MKITLVKEYLEQISKMLGIPGFETYSIEGLDIDPSKREILIEEGIKSIIEEIKNNK